MSNVQIVLFCMAVSPLQASQLDPMDLASGHRGLFFARIIPKEMGVPYDTVAFVCTLDPGYESTDGIDYRDPKTRIILKEKLTQEYLKGFDPRFWNGWVSKRVYSFGKNAAFSRRDLFRIEQGHIRIYPERVPRRRKRRTA